VHAASMVAVAIAAPSMDTLFTSSHPLESLV
jgi:hypothetical protein